VTAPVTVITATVPGREDLLARCLRSVYDQSRPVVEHIVVAQRKTTTEPAQVACARAQNTALAAVTTPWVVRLADDDELLPNAVLNLMVWAEDHDVVYGYEVAGNRQFLDYTTMDRAWLLAELGQRNGLDGSGTLVRTEALEDVGGWPTRWEDGAFQGNAFEGRLAPYEDWALWLMLARHGYRFKAVYAPTWRMGVGDHGRISDNPVSLTQP